MTELNDSPPTTSTAWTNTDPRLWAVLFWPIVIVGTGLSRKLTDWYWANYDPTTGGVTAQAQDWLFNLICTGLLIAIVTGITIPQIFRFWRETRR